MSLIRDIDELLKTTPEISDPYTNSDLIQEYDKLVEKGIVKKRGYTLAPIDDKTDDVFKECSIRASLY